MSTRRKINFYEIRVTGVPNKDQGQRLKSLFSQIYDAIKDINQNTDVPLNEELALQLQPGGSITERTHRIFGKARFIKFNKFPETYDLQRKEGRDLSENAGKSEGIVEETHFVVDIQYPIPIIAIETSQGGPKDGNIKYFLDWWLGADRDNGHEIVIQSILGKKAEDFIKTIEECASLHMKIRREHIPNLESSSQQLYSMFRAAQEFGETDYVSLDMGYRFRVKESEKPDTTPLINRVSDLVNKQMRSEFFSSFESLYIKASEKDDTHLKLFDLIQERTASEIYVPKKNLRSKYFNSPDVYHEISKEIAKTIGAPPNATREVS